MALSILTSIVSCGLVLLLTNNELVNCQSLNQSKTLMTDMLTGYDKRHRPVLNQSQAVTVTVSFDLVAIQDFDEVEEMFSVVGVLYLSWKDEAIVWNPSSYGGIWSQMYKLEDVWYPILIQANPYDKILDIGDDWMSIRFVFNGEAYFTPGAVFKSTCSVDVTYYPFDTQTCTLLFLPWGFSPQEMKLVSGQPQVLQSFYSENGEWILESTSATQDTSDSFDSITFTFNIKRKPVFLVVNVILPIIFLAAINILVFVLPVDAGERVSYAITVLLSIAVFLTLVGDNMPKISEPMSVLSYFLMLVLIMSTLMCVVTIFNLTVYYKESTHVPRWCAALTRFMQCKRKSCCKRKNNNNDESSVKKDIKIAHLNMGSSEKRNNRVVAFSDENKDEPEEEVGWKDVSAAVDRLSIIFFSLALFISTTTYLNILVGNKQP